MFGGQAEKPCYARVAVVALIRGQDEQGERWFLVRIPDNLVPAYIGRPAPAAGVWAPPGGRLDEGESLEQGLVREMQEELGLAVESAGPCGAYLAPYKGELLLAVTMACRFKDQAKGKPVLDVHEAVDFRWVTTEEWLVLADEGATPWRRRDIIAATRLGSLLWRLKDEGLD